jgi:hypothetical protein
MGGFTLVNPFYPEGPPTLNNEGSNHDQVPAHNAQTRQEGEKRLAEEQRNTNLRRIRTDYQTFYQYLQLQNERAGRLTVKRFIQLVTDNKIKFPTVAVEEIRDKSKVDFLDKAITVLRPVGLSFSVLRVINKAATVSPISNWSQLLWPR